MSLTYFFKLVSLFIFLLLASCSSDPCESVVCVNGDCNEGICDCSEGWKGPNCDVVDYQYVGEYRSTRLSTFDCPSDETEQSFNANSDFEVCSEDGEWITCLSVVLRLEPDQSFFFNIIVSRSNGTVTSGNPTVVRGNYMTNGNEISLCDGPGDCVTMTLDMSQDFIVFDQVLGSAEDCGIRWELSRQ